MAKVKSEPATDIPAPAMIIDLVDRFARNREAYRAGQYNETQVRREFIDPLFKALGWDIDNEQGYAEAYKDVVHEDAIRIGGAVKAPDYCFRIGGTRKFFLEAKKPSVDIKGDPTPAFQLRRYAWSGKLPLSVLTDFEEFAVYDCRIKPDKADKSSTARIAYYTFDQYTDPKVWSAIASVFARDAILKGSFDKYAQSTKRKRGTAEVDDAFLAEIEEWRSELAKNIARRNASITHRELNAAVQLTVDRLIFLRICEDRGIEDYGRLQALLNGDRVYQRLFDLFAQADQRYNSGLFYFKIEKGRGQPDSLTPSLSIDDKVLKGIIKGLYYPDSPYEFSVLSADILGHVYEQFLGKVISLTKGHQAKIEEKPEVRKAGGVYYTPTYIVDYIVTHTVGKLLEGQSVKWIGTEKGRAVDQPRLSRTLRVLDPACGSGSFLIGAYQHLLDWHLQWYLNNEPEKWAKRRKPPIAANQRGEYRLTTPERKRILLEHIYGVDIDSQAVEVTKLSLLLKVLEGETAHSLGTHLWYEKERALPDLSANIKCGNSLIGPDFYDNQQQTMFDEEERYRINAFDWKAEFAEVFVGSSATTSRAHEEAVGSCSTSRAREEAGGIDSTSRAREEAELDKRSATQPPNRAKGIEASGHQGIEGAKPPLAHPRGSSDEGGFDAVIGNPPYVRMEAFAPVKNYLRVHYNSHEERADLYTYFLEKALSLLDARGLLGMIVSNKFIKAKYGGPLRLVLAKRGKVEQLIDLAGAPVFHGATVRTVIIIAMPANTDAAYRTQYAPVPSSETIAAIAGSIATLDSHVKSKSYLLAPNALSGEEWSTSSELQAELIRKLRRASTPLCQQLGQTALFGLKTGCNEAFIIDRATCETYMKRDARARNLVRPVLFGRDVRRYATEEVGRFVIYFHPDKDIDESSALRAHLEAFRSTLGRRAGSQQWFELQQPATALLPYQSKAKIIYPIIANECRFTLDRDGYLVNDKTFMLATDDLGILGILNSRVSNFYFASVCAALEGPSGRYLEFRAQYVDRFPLPKIEKTAQRTLVSLVQRMLDLHKGLAGAKTAHERTVIERDIEATDRQIDRLVYDLYGLTEEEIAIVEEGTG